MNPVIKNIEILSVKKGDWFINIMTCRSNNGLPNQSYYLTINANIEAVKRLTDSKCFTANNSRLKTKAGNTIYATHFWVNPYLNIISIAGYYKEHKNPYTDDTIRNNYFSPNICSIDDLM